MVEQNRDPHVCCYERAGVQSVYVYNARVIDPKPWARCQGSELKEEGPS